MGGFSKVLVANRGEIAVRVIQSARKLGYGTVAVYSEADAQARHVREADEAVCIGPAPVGASYLVIDNILDAASRSGADAIHPGYGFLAENAAFAEACETRGITFIGPSAEAIRLMGSKRLSKIAMLEAGVPCIPGYEGENQDDGALISEAARVGFPIMVKASAGGGGRGMRLVMTPDDLPEMLKSARSEATSAFGDGELILEKAVVEPRHIEIQVFGDTHGSVIFLGERDCSVQRRHQKVVEEAPSPFVDETLREKMGEAAVRAARACSYVGAGTVEFLVDRDRNFYFLEMNTRLQVEHPVTELVTGTDLVAWQLQVAAGDPLPLTQSDVTMTGHAMEVRLYAEDPSRGFLPQTGRIVRWSPSDGDGIRVDHGVLEGGTVSPHYDPMLAKVIAFGETREQSRRRLIRALRETTLLGVTTNKSFLVDVLSDDIFAAGQATTAFIGSQQSVDESSAVEAQVIAMSVSAAIIFLSAGEAVAQNATFAGWSNVALMPTPFKFACGEEEIELFLDFGGDQTTPDFEVRLDERKVELSITRWGDGACVYRVDGVEGAARYSHEGLSFYIDCGHHEFELHDVTHRAAASLEGPGSGRLVAAMDGAVVGVHVAQGDAVSKGQTLVVLEAMKMEHLLKADLDGVVESVSVAQGDQVKGKQLLLVITPTEEA